MTQHLLILGANGFIGSHLVERILADTDWTVTAMDLQNHKLSAVLNHPRFQFTQGDITTSHTWIRERIQDADIVLPLVAIANPALYVTDPLRVFALDFEANLPIIRWCVELKKRLVFPSTSEVYGMCPDDAFSEDSSPLVLGPIHKQRWIYACAKQMLDRVIYAHGERDGLDYTLFRPFNWIGPRLDELGSPHPTRSITQFIDGILNKGEINLVDGGKQRRTFTDIDDGIAGLMRILHNHHGAATRKIFNLGNPQNERSIAEFVQDLLAAFSAFPAYSDRAKNVRIHTTPAAEFYGESYQDVDRRVPCIEAAQTLLEWTPRIALPETLHKTLAFYLNS